MSCDIEVLKRVPLFSLLDNEERAVLSAHVETRHFDAHERIYKRGEPGSRGYVVVDGRVRVTLIDDDQQEVTLDEPGPGGFFGLASLLEGSTHRTSATALEASTCIEIDREDLRLLLHKKPDSGMDMLAVLGTHFRATQRLVQMRSVRNPNEIIEKRATVGDRVADSVARFGGSWKFIIYFSIGMAIYAGVNVFLRGKAWDPYPFILLNLFLSMLAALQAPVIMMSQNRQDTKDRVRSELDFEVNRRAEMEVRALASKVLELMEKMDDIEQLIRRAS